MVNGDPFLKQMMDLGGMTDAELNSLIGDMSRQQITQLLRARGTHAMFSAAVNTPSSNPSSTSLSSSLPSASSRASSASSSPPNSNSTFWPHDAKSVTLYIAPRGRTRPSVSVDGLKVETFLRVAGVRFVPLSSISPCTE